MLLDLPPMDVDRVSELVSCAGGLLLHNTTIGQKQLTLQLLQDAANLKVQYTLPGPIDDDDD